HPGSPKAAHALTIGLDQSDRAAQIRPAANKAGQLHPSETGIACWNTFLKSMILHTLAKKTIFLKDPSTFRFKPMKIRASALAFS
ncbi:hypothetical protein R5H30_21610, partial [Sulfitobacter sp. D35]|uniref:hypothetical protein n=1 Tax=Sulfitobacter sp. D35 TaxID=3083252 RepID=UPI00296FB048